MLSNWSGTTGKLPHRTNSPGPYILSYKLMARNMEDLSGKQKVAEVMGAVVVAVENET